MSLVNPSKMTFWYLSPKFPRDLLKTANFLFSKLIFSVKNHLNLSNFSYSFESFNWFRKWGKTLVKWLLILSSSKWWVWNLKFHYWNCSNTSQPKHNKRQSNNMSRLNNLHILVFVILSIILTSKAAKTKVNFTMIKPSLLYESS